MWTSAQLSKESTVRFLRIRNRDLDHGDPATLEIMRANGHKPCVVLQPAPATSRPGFGSVSPAGAGRGHRHCPTVGPHLSGETWPAPLGVIWEDWRASPIRNRCGVSTMGTLHGCDTGMPAWAWPFGALRCWRQPSARSSAPLKRRSNPSGGVVLLVAAPARNTGDCPV